MSACGPGRHLTLVAYDTPSPGRRRRISTTLVRLGARVQKSVFLLWLTELERARLHRTLLRVVTDQDSLVIQPVCSRCNDVARRHNAQLPPPRPQMLIA